MDTQAQSQAQSHTHTHTMHVYVQLAFTLITNAHGGDIELMAISRGGLSVCHTLAGAGAWSGDMAEWNPPIHQSPNM